MATMEGDGGNAFVYDRLLPIGADSDGSLGSIDPRDEEEVPASRVVHVRDVPGAPRIERGDGDAEEMGFLALAVNGLAAEDDPDDNLAATTELELQQDNLNKKIWPWMEARALTKAAPLRSPLLQLHQEILDFCKFISPTEEEALERVAAIKRVRTAVKSVWPMSKVEIFGSYATGLYLPTSDIDAVILDSGCENIVNGLRIVAKELRKRDLSRRITIIAKARVPIIKFVELASGFSFDLSFDLTNGPEAAKFIERAIATLPPLRPLCMVLKIFLQQRELNEVYSGGLGSYGLLVMLMTHLQMHVSRQASGVLEANLGILLLDFFELYGRTLNIKDVGVSCADGGRFFSKASKGFVDHKKPTQLAIEDPQARENDIGKNSYCIAKVRTAFGLAHRLLSSSSPSNPNTGLLGRIIRGDAILTSRKRSTGGGDDEAATVAYFFNPGNEYRENLPAIDPPRRPKQKKRNRSKHDGGGGGGGGGADNNAAKQQKRKKRKRDDAQNRKTKWRKVEGTPSPNLSRRSTYTDHGDHDSKRFK